MERLTQEEIKTWKAEEFEPDNIKRFCDVVMKGGVTSGVVYPPAICYLASKYILKNIGGTSVGAIGAAITAAAEYQRRMTGSGAGYAALSRLPQFLTQPGTLQALFTADPGAKSFLNVALKFTGSLNWVFKTALGVIQFWWQTLISGVAIYCIWYGLLAWITGAEYRELFSRLLWSAGWLTFVSLIFAVPAMYALACNWKLNRNDFGWGHGYHPSDDAKLAAITDATALTKAETPRLIGWLDAFIQQAAGRTTADAPLTFWDLWQAPNPPWHPKADAYERGVDFRMVTTCLTLGRPFEVPFDPTENISFKPEPQSMNKRGFARPDLYFQIEDMQRLFPKHIVKHLVDNGVPHTRHEGYIRFPAADAVPVVVAARLSMSFPVLFCAVRFYATDVNGEMQPVWFSDGGLTSNFPIQFFDAPLPRWPTFAIDLLGNDPAEKKHSGRYSAGTVLLESQREPGKINPWNPLGKGNGSMAGFLMAIVDTARTWLDETSLTLRGNASRTIGIRLSSTEGGINLAMPPEVVTSMVLRGEKAGQKLIKLFANGDDLPAWQYQRWMRYRGAMGALTRWLDGFQTGYAGLSNDPQASYDALVQKCYSPVRTASAQNATELVSDLKSNWVKPPHNDPEFTTDEPMPFPVFAQRRPL